MTSVGPGVRLSKAELGHISRIGAGGQGTVYGAPALKLQYVDAGVYKEYKRELRSDVDVGALEAMTSFIETLSFYDGMQLISQAAWPIRIVMDGARVSGFVMPEIPADFFLDLRLASGVKKSPGEFQHLLNPEAFLAKRGIALSDRHRYELLGALANALSVFHGHQVAVGDLSAKNVLFSIRPSARVFFIDCDAMRFRGRSVVPQRESPDWDVATVNAGEELATPESDSYKLGLLALRLFIGDQLRRDPSALPTTVPADVRALVEQSLQVRPADRPAPSEWSRPLSAAASAASTRAPGAVTPGVARTSLAAASGPAPTVATGLPPPPVVPRDGVLQKFKRLASRPRKRSVFGGIIAFAVLLWASGEFQPGETVLFYHTIGLPTERQMREEVRPFRFLPHPSERTTYPAEVRAEFNGVGRGRMRIRYGDRLRPSKQLWPRSKSNYGHLELTKGPGEKAWRGLYITHWGNLYSRDGRVVFENCRFNGAVVERCEGHLYYGGKRKEKKHFVGAVLIQRHKAKQR